MSARVEAAAEAIEGYSGALYLSEIEARFYAEDALSAADAVMFNEAAVGRVARAIASNSGAWSSEEWDKGRVPDRYMERTRHQARAVIATLKGAGQ
ncbi:hypothetical protein [Arthrobacter sp. UYCu723]